MRVNVSSAVSSLCAERPNDNPALHGGVIWACLSTTGAASAVPTEHRVANDDERVTIPAAIESGVFAASVREDEAMSLEALAAAVGVVMAPVGESASEDEEELIVVEELPPLDLVEIEGSGIAPPPPGDAWTAFVSALAGVAIGAGSPHAASLVTGLLVDASMDSLPAELAPALADVVEGGRVTGRFRSKVDAWRGIVRGTSEDFSKCGDAMLDEWAADLLARLVGGTARATTLKRELRERGVAAFGFSQAA